MEPPSIVKMDSFKRIQGASLVMDHKNYPIFKGINTVGRNKTAIVNIKHLNVSQNQAVFVLVDDIRHYISDLNSSNGTFLYNTKLVPFKLYELADNVEIKFGDVSAIYTKISGKNRINLQETLDTNETQDMTQTQNFYASNTQLIFNDTNSSDHIYSNLETTNTTIYDIHDEATQVVDQPSQLPKTQNFINEECVIEEALDDIHDAPTQVVFIRKSSQNSVYEKDIHEAPTQETGLQKSSMEVINVDESENKTSSGSNTQVITAEENEELMNRINEKNLSNREIEIIIGTSEEAKKSSSSQDEKVLENEETIGNTEEIKNPSSLQDEKVLVTIENKEKRCDEEIFKKKNFIHDSQKPSTSKYDESVLNNYKGIIEETIVENTNSNDSLDFLNESNKSIKGISKVIISQNFNHIENSDEEIESQEIGLKKRISKPIISQSSDSDTEVEENQLKSESETDCEEEISDISKNQISNLDDSDLIPATQDAFAEALGYPPIRSQNTNQSSEESFKLGLTELMEDDTMKDEEKSQDTKKFNFKKKSVNLEESLTTIFRTGNDTTIVDDVFLQPTQKIDSENQDEPICLKKQEMDETNDDIFLQPTQKLIKNKDKSNSTKDSENHEIDDEIFLQPTQKVVKSNLKDKKCLDDEGFAIPAIKDIYNQPTQAFGTEGGSSVVQNTENDDVYAASTQIIQEDALVVKRTEDNSLTQEDLYGQATQKLDMKSTEKPNQNRNTDIYDLATQQLESDTQLEMNFNSQCSNIKISDTSNRPGNPILHELNQSTKDEIISKVPETISQSNQDTSQIPIQDKVPNEIETLSQIEAFIKKPLPPSQARRSVRKSKIENDVPETLSQIAAFVNKTFPKIEESNKEKPQPEIVNEDQYSSDTSRELKSNLDHSFALLESKHTKTRRNYKNDSILDEIKVTVTSHRRSMGIAENLKGKEPKKATKSRICSTISENEKRISTRIKKPTEKKKLINNDSDSDGEMFKPIKKKINRSSKRKILDSSEENDTNKRVFKLESIEEDEIKEQKVINIEESSKSSKNNNKKQTRASSTSSNEKIVKKRTKNEELPKISINESNKKISKRHIESKEEDDSNSNSKDSDIIKSHKVSKRIKKQVTDSEQSKHGNLDNIPSDDTDAGSSTSNDNMVTPRKGRNCPKIESLLSSADRTKRKQRPKVVFTLLDNPQLESFIKHLGGSVVDSVDSCTVLVTQSIKRSQKLLTAVAQGKPICSPDWIQSSKKNNEFLDPWDYLLIDEESEKKWDFSLKESIIRARNKKIFSGYFFQLMVTTAVDVLKGAIEASGGKIVKKTPESSELQNFFVIASADQKSKYQRIKKQYPIVRVLEPEAIFDGVLRQEFKLSKHILL